METRIPPLELGGALAVSAVLALLFFYPAVLDFGHALMGKEDIGFFLWLFWHYERGGSPAFAEEIFHPFGISLSHTTLVPFQGILYLLMPAAWGAFGKITLIQLLSFIIGGVSAFMLVRRFAGSFLPSLAGALIYGFSSLHFEKAVHHLNYSMAMAFIPLFLYYYFEGREKGGRKLLSALSLLAVALNEAILAVMLGFFVMLDIFVLYCRAGGVRILTPRNTALLCASVIASLVLNLVLAILPLPPLASYIIPPLPFMGALAFIIGPGKLMESERKRGSLRHAATIALPAIGYLLLLAALPGYDYENEAVIANDIRYAVPVEYLVIPSDFQAISWLAGGLDARSESGLYIGVLSIGLMALSIASGKKGDEERFRDLFFLFLLFSFPAIGIGDSLYAISPFFAQSLFPLLALLRVPSRFMVLSTLFLAIAAGMRLSDMQKRKGGAVIVAVICLLLVAERIPDSGRFMFDGSVPEFYRGLSDQGNVSFFLYPNFDYYTLLESVYHQTAHGKPISFGVVSRFPESGNPLYDYYSEALAGDADAGRAAEFARENGYSHIVVQKRKCIGECFMRPMQDLGGGDFEELKALMEKSGDKVFEDDTVIVYSIG